MSNEPAVDVDLTIRDEVLQVRSSLTRWLSTGWNGGYHSSHTAYNITVPDGWNTIDLDEYITQRRTEADFDSDGPALLTGVHMKNARAATSGPVTAIATAGMSNPADLPIRTDGGTEIASPGTVNVILHAATPVTQSALSGLLMTVIEAKTATLLAATGFPGTTTDAAIVGTATGNQEATFAGPATTLGAHARVCVRDAVLAALDARDQPVPTSVTEADSGVTTDQSTTVFAPIEH